MPLPQLLNQEQVEAFHRDGVIVLRAFYNLAIDIHPIQRCIHHVLGLLIAKYELPVKQRSFSAETFDDGYQALIAQDRRIGGEVYDAVKNIPAFVRLCCHDKHDALMAQLSRTATPGFAYGGSGIRIDNPREERFRAGWHQDYPAQLRSPDGLVFWSPLAPVTDEMGPVVFCVGSHRDGLVPVHTRDPRNPDKSGAYALTLQHELELVAKYPHSAPTTMPGDLVVISYSTIHCSGWNRSQRSRWTMQMRYFNFDDPFAIKIGWKGGFAAGVQLRDVHPELVLD